jgi:hypothetical protein
MHPVKGFELGASHDLVQRRQNPIRIIAGMLLGFLAMDLLQAQDIGIDAIEHLAQDRSALR